MYFEHIHLLSFYPLCPRPINFLFSNLSSVVQHLLNMQEALDSIPNTTTTHPPRAKATQVTQQNFWTFKNAILSKIRFSGINASKLFLPLSYFLSHTTRPTIHITVTVSKSCHFTRVLIICERRSLISLFHTSKQSEWKLYQSERTHWISLSF